MNRLLFFSPLRSLCLAWLSIGVALQASNGHYHPISIALVLIGAAFIISAGYHRLHETVTNPDSLSNLPRLLAITLLIALTISLTRAPGIYLNGAWYWILFAGLTGTLTVTIAFVIFKSDFSGRLSSFIFIGGVAVAFTLKLLMVTASPTPIIDVHSMFQESSRHLLEGRNPFATPVTDIYQGRQNYGYEVFGYSYPPANLYFQVPSYYLFGDVRYAHVAAEALAAWCLYCLSRDIKSGRWLVLLYLFTPRNLFVIEQGWAEPLMVGAFGLTLLFAIRHGGSGRLAIAYGLLLSLKQYLVFFILHGLLLERRPMRIMLAGAAGLATLAPFLIWDAYSLVKYGFIFQLTNPFRPDGLTVGAAIYASTGIVMPKPILATIAICVAVVTFVVFRHLGVEGWQWATLITTMSVFMFGSQAFCNYYYFLDALILFLIARLRTH